MADEINEILPFAPEGDEALGDLEPLATYQDHLVRRRGHQPGIALRAIENRALRQALHMAAGLARWIAGRHAPGVRDDGDLDAVVAGLAAASASGQVPSDRTIAAGTGLSGGGSLAANRTLSFDATWGDGRYALASRTLTAGDGLSGGGNLTANRSLAVDSSVVRTARTITAGTGLSGGGSLAADRTLTFDATWGDGRYALASRTLTAGDGLSGGGNLTANRTLAVDGSVVRTARTIAAGDGLSGGGTLAADRALAVDGSVMRRNATNEISSGNFAHRNGQTAFLRMSGGEAIGEGGDLTLYGPESAGTPGEARLAGAVVRLMAEGQSVTWNGDALIVNGDVHVTGGLSGGGVVPEARTIAAGDGLSGGGNLSVNRTLAVDSSVVRTARTITAGTGLSGGGSLAANRTLSFDAVWGDGRYALASRTITAGDGLSGGGTLATDRSLAVDGTVVRTGRTITAGDGLTGGGTLATDRSLAVDTTVMRRNALNEVGVSNFAHRSTQTGWLRMSGGNAIGQGGEMILYGPEHPSFPAEARLTGGLVRLTANNQSVTWNGATLSVPGDVHVDGTLSGGGVVPDGRTIAAGDGLTGGGTLAADRALAVDGSVMRRNAANEISFGNFAHRNGQTSYLRMSGGEAIGEGGELILYGPEHASSPGHARLVSNGVFLIWDGTVPTAGGQPLAAFSTTTAAGTTSFPVGHTVLVEADALNARNGSVTVRLHSSDTGRYTHTGAGAALAGTWRARGYSVASGAVIGLAQRVA